MRRTTMMQACEKQPQPQKRSRSPQNRATTRHDPEDRRRPLVSGWAAAPPLSRRLRRANSDCEHRDFSQAGAPETNGIVESMVRVLTWGTRVALEIAGLPSCFWPHALAHYCHARNIAPGGLRLPNDTRTSQQQKIPTCRVITL